MVSQTANKYSRTALIQMLVIWTANYTDWLCPSGKFVQNSKKQTYLEITDYQIKYRTVLWLLELQIRRGRKVYTQVHNVYGNSWDSNCKCSLFSKKNPVIWIFCISGRLTVIINPDKWSSTVLYRSTVLRCCIHSSTVLCCIYSSTNGNQNH